MKSLKSIIIAGIVLIVFIVASVIVINIPSAGEVEEAETSAAVSAETIYVVNEDYSAMTGFTVVPTEREVSEDTAFAYASQEFDVKITKTVSDEGSVDYSYEASPDPGKFEYKTSLFRSMMYTLSSITAKTLVEEDAKDLSIYGLDNPTCVVKTYYEGDKEIDIIVGSLAPVDGDYYCMTSLNNNVYTIGSYVDSLLVRKPIEYRDITLFPAYDEETVYENIDWVRITQKDGDVIEVLWDQYLDNEYNTEQSQYVMLQPYQVSGNTTTIQSYILDVVYTLSLGTIVEDITEDDYAKYGFDTPSKLEMTDISGNELSLLIGDVCPNNSYTYCMIEGTNTVLTANTEAFDFENINYVQLMLRSIWTYSIEQLASIDIEIGGEKYDLDVTHYIKQNANGNDADGVEGTLNGQEISETNVRRLFVRCLYFRIIDNLTAEEKELCQDTDVYATITLNLFDESHTLELIPVTDRKYGLRVDGELEYYCYKASLTSLVDSIRYVQEGDELDMNFG